MPQRGGQPPLFGITEAAINAASAIFPSGPVPLALLGGGKKKRKKASKKRRKRRTKNGRCMCRCQKCKDNGMCYCGCKKCSCKKPKRSKRKSRRKTRRRSRK